jgi:glycyl-tRNA synthetase beta chain
VPELLIELFSEEIPARMQGRAADDLVRLVGEALAPLRPAGMQGFAGPRRIALVGEVAAEVPGSEVEERGPRLGAPEQAVAGFLRKHGASREDLVEQGGHWLLRRALQARPAAAVIAEALPPLLWRFPWPKSMRWGEGSAFTWVRPLRRILCLLDGRVVPFALAEGDDPAHGLASGNLTEGHRFMAPGAFAVQGFTEWREGLRARCVLVAAGERKRVVAEGIARLAHAEGLSVVEDDGLLDEVAGLVEWPVPLLGRIDERFMDLPPEVMQVSMRVNQRYFALRDAEGRPAPRFAFAANVEAKDGGAAIIAGNERVLRARFSDARHFWDLDRRTPLAERVAALDGVTFHAKLGSQGARVERLVRLAQLLAPQIRADIGLAARAAYLSKADLVTGMVGEFPELQGIMGGYYARHDGQPDAVADAIRDHYAPKGPGDAVPTAPITVAVALADRLDQLAAFFAAGEQPSGSGDPYALRRAALGTIRLVRGNTLHLVLRKVFAAAGEGLPAPVPVNELVAFIVERLRVQLRAEGARHDVLAAVFAAGADDDLLRLLARADALAGLLGTENGANLLTAYRRATNILRIEEKRDGPHDKPPDPDSFEQSEETELARAIILTENRVRRDMDREDFTDAMTALASLRAPLDAFFDKVTVNAPDPDLRRNRLRLLNRVRAAMDRVADFSKIEG